MCIRSYDWWYILKTYDWIGGQYWLLEWWCYLDIVVGALEIVGVAFVKCSNRWFPMGMSIFRGYAAEICTWSSLNVFLIFHEYKNIVMIFQGI